MPEKPSRLFTVVCKSCEGTLMTIERITDPEIGVVTDHLRACAPSEPLANAPMLGEIMGRVRVTAVGQT